MTATLLKPIDASPLPARPAVAVHELEPPAPRLARIKIDCKLDYDLTDVCHFIFLVHAARNVSQTLIAEELTLTPHTPYRTYEDPHSGNHFLRLTAQPGAFSVSYRANIERAIEVVDENAAEMPVAELPDPVLRFLMPTRYCESDHLGPAAQQLFGNLPKGYARVKAVSDWVGQNINYRIGSSDALTTARDVFVQRAGVCRDFAHLSISLCRALNIPARVVAAYALFVEPPPDFHAVFEAYLDGRWVMFDPTGMADTDNMVRIAVGRDAKDVAFSTIYGPARMVSMSPKVELLNQQIRAT